MEHTQLKKILYVEDESDIRAVAQIALEDIGGFIVKYCSRGEEAIMSAEEFQPDLLLLDVMMPGMDGMTTLQKLREIPALKNTPAVFMTAKIQAHEIEGYREFGVAGVIEKPFDPMLLAGTVKKYWQVAYERK